MYRSLYPFRSSMSGVVRPRATIFPFSKQLRGVRLRGPEAAMLVTPQGQTAGTLADSKVGTLSFWFKIEGNESQFRTFFFLHGNVLSAKIDSGGIVWLQGTNGIVSTLLFYQTTGTYLKSNHPGWIHYLASWDLSTAGTQRQYLDDISDMSLQTYTNANLGYSIQPGGTCQIGTNNNTCYSGSIAEVWFATTYLDLNTVANRRLFITEDKRPAPLGDYGQAPLGGIRPAFYFSGRGKSLSSFLFNRGSIGGTLTPYGVAQSSAFSRGYVDFSQPVTQSGQ